MESYPYVEVSVASLGDDKAIEREFRLNLVGRWAIEKSPSQYATNELARRLSCAWFEKISHDPSPPEKTSFGCLKESFRSSEGPEDCLFAIGCLEKIVKRKGREPSSARMYLIGFADPKSPLLTMGSTIEADFVLHGARVGDQAVLFPCYALAWNVFDEEARPVTEVLEDIALSREQPLVWIYIYHWDPPLAEDAVRWDLEKEVLERVSNLIRGTRMPVESQRDYHRDRICTHALVLAACTDDEIAEWYIEAECSLLSDNLSLLRDFEDRVLTMRNNFIEYGTLAKLEIYETFETRVIDLCRSRLRSAIDGARAMLTSDRYMRRSPREGDEEFFSLIQRVRDAVFEILSNQ